MQAQTENDDTMALLDCLAEGAAAEEGGPLRELCARGVVEFLRYAIKQSSKRQQVNRIHQVADVGRQTDKPEKCEFVYLEETHTSMIEVGTTPSTLSPYWEVFYHFRVVHRYPLSATANIHLLNMLGSNFGSLAHPFHGNVACKGGPCLQSSLSHQFTVCCLQPVGPASHALFYYLP